MSREQRLRIVASAIVGAVLLLSSACSARSRPPADVPLGHWSYPMLERLTARGVIELDLSTLPVSREAVSEALSDAVDMSLTGRETWMVDRLKAEFFDSEVDRPLLELRTSKQASIALGLKAFGQLRQGEETLVPGIWPGIMPGGVTPENGFGHALWDDSRPEEGGGGVPVDAGGGDNEEVNAAGDLTYELWGGLDDAFGFYADTQILVGAEKGARKVRLTSRVRTWRDAAVSADRAYFKLRRESLTVVLGRRGAEWGRSRWGGLMLSGQAPTFDMLGARYDVGALRLEALHALLERAFEEDGASEQAERSYLAAHRLVVAWKRGSVGVGEAVVYSSSLPEPSYLNPLLPYYVAQHNERANDNVLWSLDFDYRIGGGAEFWGEFLVDDLQYERSTESPDKYGVTVGGAWYGVALDKDVEATVEYTNVRKWTYTHGLSQNAFVQDGFPVGFDLGPDADQITLQIVAHPAIKWSAGVTYRRWRKGEGRVFEPFESGENPEPKFPSGIVETTMRTSLEVGYQSLERLSAGFGIAFESSDNVGNVLGETDEDLEIWAGVEFRI